MKWITPLLVILWCGHSGLAQQITLNFWRDLPDDEIPQNLRRSPQTGMNDYRSLHLDAEGMRQALRDAPKEGTGGRSVVLTFPLPDGRNEPFAVVESALMEPELARRYPNIRSYLGTSLRHPSTSIRFDFTPRGFHASIFETGGTTYIDPYSREAPGSGIYRAYDISRNPGPYDPREFQCGVDHEASPAPVPAPGESGSEEDRIDFRNDNETIPLRVYRLGLACTGEYTQYHGGKENALASMVTILNRINQIYERDLAIRLVLVGNNDTLIFNDGVIDPYSNGNEEQMLKQNATVLNARIGTQNYDIGHVLGTHASFGGIASLGVACQNNGKANGASAMRQPEGDAFVIRIIAHEIGHQMDANHSFNSCHNVNDETAFEPGGGTTIMSYAGICDNPLNNLQELSDDYFHVISLDEIYTYTRKSSGRNCAENIPTPNHKPEIRIPLENDFFIPTGTPFRLEADASDIDGDSLTYSWEQLDLGPINSVPGTPEGNSPLFRSFPPAPTPERVFPKMEKILNQDFDRSEVLPAYGRDLTFRCTVRDNFSIAGGVNWEEVRFHVDSTSGPFRITMPNKLDVRWNAGSYMEVLWEVANTNNETVNCQYVNVRLSVDGGKTFPYLLAENTPNDGSAFVTIPNITSTNQARLMIEAADNIFFDVSDQNFEIWPPNKASYTLDVSPAGIPAHCLPEVLTFDVASGSIGGFNQPLNLDLVGDLPEEATYYFSRNPVSPLDGETAQLVIDLGTFVEDTFDLQVQVTAPDLDTAFRELQFVTLSNDFSRLIPLAPSDQLRNVRSVPEFRWSDVPDADRYRFELATSPAFGSTVIATASDLTDTTFTPSIVLEENTIFYWRVIPFNTCGAGTPTAVQTFQSAVNVCNTYEAENLPINIAGTGRPTIESTIIIEEEGTLSDLNVPLIQAKYQPIRSLRITLISPAGTEAVLFDQNCSSTINIETGFDDEALEPIQCPPDDGLRFRPVDSLDRFIGENIQGAWTLRVAVVNSGFGASGALQAWNLELCAALAPEDPFLVNMDTLFVRSAKSNVITQNELLAGDNDNGPEELQFTIVTPPENGILRIEGDTLRAGDTFTQTDIDDYMLLYTHDGSELERDSFTFLIQDGEGGWLPVHVFPIRVNENAVVDTENILDNPNALRIYPNPLRDHFFIQFEEAVRVPLQVRLVSLQGQVIWTRRHEQPETLLSYQVSGLAPGIYFVQLQSSQSSVTRKLIIQE